MDDRLREELLARARRDQDARQGTAPDVEAMALVDAENLPWLKQTVAATGWPTRSTVGAEASHAAWLLVQHADRDPGFQRHCLGLLTAAAAEGEADLQEVAYLTDRVLLAQGRPQEYGTQVTAREGRWAPRQLREPQTVDERRAGMGLEPLVDYLTMFDEPPRPNVLPCQDCRTGIEFWLPDPGEQVALACPSCGWTTTVWVDTEPG